MSSIIALLATGATLYSFMMIIGPVSGLKLHDILVKSTFAAPMSFFEGIDSSVILNRFSQDMTLIDMALPSSTFEFVLSAASCLMSLILVCIGSDWVAITIPGVVIGIYFIQRFYLRTSRQIRLLDLEHKSPLYQLFTETNEGLETIRCFGWQEYFNQDQLRRLDISQRPFYTLYMIQRWLNFVLDLMVCFIAVLLVALALCVPSSSTAGSLGVALSSVLSFNTNLKMLITTWTQAETSLGSVARTRFYEKNTPSEDQVEDLDPGKDWPKGKVEFNNISLTYEDGTQALKAVTFTIEAGRKIGICGRTGSGKSTLLSSILRLLDPNDGTIVIDDVNISHMKRNHVRHRIICLPQDPLIFPGNFRFNVDPASTTPEDEVIVEILKIVNLGDVIEKRGGLLYELKIDSLSHGEQQLLALARALLRKRVANGRCILVLDEATSNLDRATEVIIQKIIEEEFKENTVITVAHRLETVAGADEVLLLENGEIIKQGSPLEVLDFGP